MRADIAAEVKVGCRTVDHIDRVTLRWDNMYIKWKAIDLVVMEWFPSASLMEKTFGRNGGFLEYNTGENK
jgi:hypothetical protein